MQPTKKRQLSNAAATWLNSHKDGLMPTLDELDSLVDDCSIDLDCEGYKCVPVAQLDSATEF